ncbi:hypothetical protein GCM10025795_52990 [Verticiella sediminum]
MISTRFLLTASVQDFDTMLLPTIGVALAFRALGAVTRAGPMRGEPQRRASFNIVSGYIRSRAGT